MRNQTTETTTSNNSSVVVQRNHRTDLNDVLNFIRKANRLEKRAIDLALEQKNEYKFEVNFKHGKNIRSEFWYVDTPEDFVDILIKSRKMPVSVVMERRINYAN